MLVVVEMSQSNWLVAGMLPGVERRPLKNSTLIRMQVRELIADAFKDMAAPVVAELPIAARPARRNNPI